ncbi:PaaI family thioesterase [Mycobacterium sp. 29Ha]|uniref:PaaI family thioesterase n=1 Tax=Mycobacterium sp. 29Ha TaxID=2939268 RepID=UPI0029391F9A|nr:PaaI family thioesterase [Mycobacterium sp. 29Ha]MDV3133399.1 PaaI family thioesterase [Mycobacterium sp. 29Ha]
MADTNAPGVGVDSFQFDERIAETLLDEAASAGGLTTYLGFRHTELVAGRLIAEMDARPDLLTPFGNLHGGCLSAMVDHCLGVLFYPVIPSGSWVATTEFKVNLLRPVSSGVCVAVADIVSLGRRTGVARIDISNHGVPVCAAQGSVTIVSAKAAGS